MPGHGGLGTYLNLTTIIPSPFRESDIKDVIKLVGEGCRLMSDCAHLCSEKFIFRCLEVFKPISEELALKKIKAGIKPG